MKRRPVASFILIVSILLLTVLSVHLNNVRSEVTPDQQAKKILEKSGIKGGLIVHLNCGDGVLTEALKVNNSFLVQGLDKNEKNVQKARQYVLSKNEYGPISIDRLMGNYLPYKDNLVNLIVTDDLGNISKKEVMRVLAPNGVLLTKGASGWNKVVKTKSDKQDEWNQFLYNASGNPVSNDDTIEPIRTYQWIGSPR